MRTCPAKAALRSNRIIRLRSGGEALAFGLQTPAQPSDVWVRTLADGGLERWTESEIGPVDAKQFLAPKLVHYPTFDKVDGKPRQIPAWVYKPAGRRDRIR